RPKSRRSWPRIPVVRRYVWPRRRTQCAAPELIISIVSIAYVGKSVRPIVGLIHKLIGGARSTGLQRFPFEPGPASAPRQESAALEAFTAAPIIAWRGKAPLTIPALHPFTHASTHPRHARIEGMAIFLIGRAAKRCRNNGSRLIVIVNASRAAGPVGGQMDELIGRLVANVGVDRTAAEKAVGVILQFLIKEGPADKVQSLIDKLPGAEAAMQAAGADDGSGAMFGG